MQKEFDKTYDYSFPRVVSPASSVERKINSIVKDMGITYIFENWTTANKRLDKMPLPAVINVLPVSGQLNVGKTMLKDYPNCMLCFADKADFDFSGVTNDAVIERCKNLAMEFILRANASGLFEQISGNVPYSVFYDKADVNITGITIELQLKETKGLVLCYGKDINEYFNGE